MNHLLSDSHYTNRHTPRQPSACRLRIYGNNPVIVVATEERTTPNHPCMAERLGEPLYRRLGTPDRFLWVEHLQQPDGTRPEAFHLVEFDMSEEHFISCRRIPVTEHQVKRLIGEHEST